MVFVKTNRLLRNVLNRKNLPIFLLVLFSLVVHWKWFHSFDILTYDDWKPHFLKDSLTELDLPRAWNETGNGSVNLNSSFYPTILASGILAFFNIDFSIAERIIYMLPITVIAPIGIYLLCKYHTKNITGSVLGTLIYCFNSYFLLIQTRHLTIATAYAVFPLALYLFFKLVDLRRPLYIISFGLISCVLGFYDFRILYILLSLTTILILIKVIQLFIDGYKKKALILLLMYFASIIVIITINIYWILGLSQTSSISSNELFSRGLFGNDILNLQYALAFMMPFWNGTEPVWFKLQPINLYIWFIPVIILIGATLIRKNKTYIMYSFIAVIGILLVKQIDQPFPNLYYWLYNHIPGFSAFREASKFFVLIASAYAALIAIVYTSLSKSQSKIKRWLSLLCIVLVIINVLFLIKPFITGEINTLFKSRQIPDTYLSLAEYLEKGSDKFKVLWIPSESRWSYKTENINNVNFANIVPQADIGTPFTINAKNYLNSTAFIDYLSNANVKYVVVPIRDTANDDDFYKFYSYNRNDYIAYLDNNDNLSKLPTNLGGVRVYKNKLYKPYIFASNKLVSNDKDSTVNKQSLINNVNNKLPVEERINLTDILLNSPNLSLSIKPSENITRYISISNSPSYLRFVKSDSNVSVKAIKDYDVKTDNVNSPAYEKSIYSYNPSNESNYSISSDQNLYPVTVTNGDRLFPVSNKQNYLYRSTDASLILNSGFEDGLWQKSVNDCNNYDDKGEVSMSLATDTIKTGRYALMLNATNHTACTYKDIDLSGNTESLELKFSTYIKAGQRSGYDLVFDDSNITTVSNDEVLSAGKWSSVNQKVDIPSGAKKVRLFLKGYPDDTNKQSGSIYYDDVSLSPIILESKLDFNNTVDTSDIPVDRSSKVSISSTYDQKNLIENPSLEKGLWKKTVGDCNAYDLNPAISMSLDQRIKTDGRQSLQLSSSRHVACTGPNKINVKEGLSYLLKFDYQSPTQSEAGYYVNFNDDNGTVYSERIPTSDAKWHSFSKPLKVPFGATEMSLLVYSYSSSIENKKNINNYDNFNLYSIPGIDEKINQISIPTNYPTLISPSLKFKPISTSKSLINIDKAKTPFYITLSEGYHPQWKLELDDTQSNGPISKWSPFASPNYINSGNNTVNSSFTNNWYVNPAEVCSKKFSACTKNPDGSYNLKLIVEFTPQRYFYVGLIISSVTLVGCLSFLSYKAVKRHRSRNISEKKIHEK